MIDLAVKLQVSVLSQHLPILNKFIPSGLFSSYKLGESICQ